MAFLIAVEDTGLAIDIVKLILDAHLDAVSDRYPADQQIFAVDGTPVAIKNLLLPRGPRQHVTAIHRSELAAPRQIVLDDLGDILGRAARAGPVEGRHCNGSGVVHALGDLDHQLGAYAVGKEQGPGRQQEQSYRFHQ